MLAAAVLAAMSLLLAAPGCNDATVDFFSVAQRNLDESTSFRVVGNMDISISMNGTGSDMPVEMSVPMEEEIEQDGDSFKMKATVGVSGTFNDDGASRDEETYTTMYLLDNQLYYQAMDKWYRSDFSTPLTAMGGGNSQLLTPDSILQMLETADNVEVAGESDSEITYRFTLGDKYYQDAMDQFKKMMPDYPVEQYEDLIKAMVYELEVTVDKGTERVSRLVVDMKGDDLEFLQGYEMSMKVNGVFEFSGYGEDFDIELPDEARDAEYVDTSSVNPF